MILKTRKSSELTQEQYGEKFSVSRQTVSSWENGRTYPDMQLLIAICDEFGMSLDQLLREDKTLIKKVDHAKVIMRIISSVIKVVGFLFIAFIVFVLIWNNSRIKKENQFNAAIEECKFDMVNGVYVLNQNGTLYTVPNQKLPFLKFDFWITTMEICHPLDDDTLQIKIYEPNRIYVGANNDTDINFEIDADGQVKSTDKLNKEEKVIYEKYYKQIQSMIIRGMKLYKKIYV